MVDSEKLLRFEVGSLFHKMVTSYQAAICGLLIYHPKMGTIESDPVGFASTIYPALEFDPREIQRLIRANVISLNTITDYLTYMLINGAYESLQNNYDEQAWLQLRLAHPEIEFLRHVRNAASHGGRWYFTDREPSRPANWRGKSIDKNMHDKLLFVADFPPGDIFVLLSDIEQLLK
jgi:hypothetical protein